MPTTEPKNALRRTVSLARAAQDPAQKKIDDVARTRHALGLASADPSTIAIYAARPGEPDTATLIDALQGAGHRVLLPVLRRNPDWAEFTSWAQTQPSWGNIPEPVGARLGAAALASASLILVPALAVGRDFTRLGTGGGWYDRALTHRGAAATVIALVNEAEVFDTVPTQPHDLPIDGYVTQRGAWLR